MIRLKIFEIVRGMPHQLAYSALHMLYDQNGNGGTMGFSHPSSRRNIVAISNDAVALRFRLHMERLNVNFQQLTQIPQGVQMHTIRALDNETADQKAREFLISLGLDPDRPRRPRKRRRRPGWRR